MRLLAALVAMLAMLSGCGDRRTFDERYRDTDRALTDQARALDANLADDNLAEPANDTAANEARH